MKRSAIMLLLGSLLVTIGCASKGVDLDEAARLMGREGDVRVDAQLSTLDVRRGSNVGITYEVENLRPVPIAIADIVPEVTYDAQTGIITILLGSEVPGNAFLPRLDLVRSGERKTFRARVNLNVGSTVRTAPRAVRIRLSYLQDVEPFESLIEISEKAVHDPDLANSLFLKWIDSVRFVQTNEVPLHWIGRARDNVGRRPGRAVW